MRVKQIKLTLVFLILLPMLTGCWDRMEIEDRAVVLAIAIDEAHEAKPTENRMVSQFDQKKPDIKRDLIRVTVQIAIPGRIPLGAGSTGGGPSGQKPVWVLSSVGYTIDDALVNLQQKLADRLFYGHLRVIVVSEVMAKKGIDNAKDFFRRQPQVRRTVWMVVSKGNAGAVMKARPQLERVPSLYLLATLDHSAEMGKLPNYFLGVFYSASSAKGQEGVLPYIELKKESNIEILGLAYFKGNKMKGTTTALQIGHFMAMKQINPGGYSVMERLPGTDTDIIFKSMHRKARIKTDIQNGKVHASVICLVEGDLVEKSNEHLSVTREVIAELEKKIEQDGREGMLRLIQKTQADASDIFGFGEYVRAFQPGYWNKQIKTKENWQKMYQQMSVDVKLSIKLRRIGTKTR